MSTQPIVPSSLTQPAVASPFRGIHPFRFADQEYYFGRNELIGDLVDKVLLYRLIVLFGESGAGKSSLLNAGLIAALRKKSYQPERVRVRPFSDQPLLIERIDCSDKPGEFLPSIFATSADATAGPAFTLALNEFHRALDAAAKDNYPVLIFDQFEELFTLFGQGKDKTASGIEHFLQLRLLNTIVRLARDRERKVKIVITLREDFLGKLQILNRKYPQILDHRVRMGLLARDDARQAILGPFSEPNPFASRISPELADRIVEQLAGTHPEGLVPPTQLQIVCSRVWETYAAQKDSIGPKEFDALGQVKGIVKEFLTSELSQLDEPLRKPAIQVLGKLVTDSNTRDVVSQEKIRSLLRQNEIAPDQISAILKSLEARRLINQVAQRGTYYFELSSEFLIEPVQKELALVEHEQELARLQKEQQEQARKAFRANVLLFIFMAISLVAALATVFAFYKKREAQRALNLVRASEQRSLRLRYVANMSLGHHDLLAGNFARLSQLLIANWPDPRVLNNPDLRTFSWYYLWHAVHKEGATLRGHTGPVNSVAFSHDGKIMASASDDKTVKLWNVATESALATLTEYAAPVRSVTFSPDDKMLATGSDDGTINLWDVTSRRQLGTFGSPSVPVRSIVFSPDGLMLASTGNDAVKLWNVATRTEVATLPANIGNVFSVAFSPNGKLIAAGGNDGIRLFDAVNKKDIARLKSHIGYVLSIAFSPDGKMLASVSSDKDVKLWDITTQTELKTFSGHLADVRSVAFSPDGKTLVSVSLEGALKLWDVEKRTSLATLSGHSLGILAVAFSPDGKTLASGSQDKTVKIWYPAAQTTEDVLPEGEDRIVSIALSPDGLKVAAAVFNHAVNVWEVATRQKIITLPIGDSKSPRAVTFSRDGRLLAAAVSGGSVKIWETQTWQLLDPFKTAHSKAVNSLSFSPDGKLLASASDDFTVKVWDIATREEVASFKHTESVLSVTFSPDGKTLASSSYDRTVKLWNIDTKQEIATLGGYTQGVLCVAFSPDGRLLASGDFNNAVKIWNVATTTESATLIGHVQGVLSIAFSPDGKTLASAGYDRKLKLWDVETQQEIATLAEDPRSIYSIIFSRDGKMLVAAGSDRKVKFWYAATEQDVERQRD